MEYLLNKDSDFVVTPGQDYWIAICKICAHNWTEIVLEMTTTKYLVVGWKQFIIPQSTTNMLTSWWICKDSYINSMWTMSMLSGNRFEPFHKPKMDRHTLNFTRKHLSNKQTTRTNWGDIKAQKPRDSLLDQGCWSLWGLESRIMKAWLLELERKTGWQRYLKLR